MSNDTVENHPSHPLLTLWRTVGPVELAIRKDDIVALLAELTVQTRGVDDEGRVLLSRALQRGQRELLPYAAWAMTRGCRTSFDPPDDVAMSFAAVSALEHFQLAILAMVQSFRRNNMLSEPLRKRLLRAWQEYADIHLVYAFRAENLWRVSLETLDEAAQPMAPKTVAPAPAPSPVPSGPTLVVIQKIGDTGGSSSPVKRYECLTRPLRLRRSPLSADKLGTALLAEFPWMAAAVERIVDDLIFGEATGRLWFRIRPLLLLGPPGIGKTRFARRLAELSAIPYGVIGAAGSSDNRMLQGTSRGWSSAQPSLPLVLMATHGTANPMLFVDEIDKLGESQWSSPHLRRPMGYLERSRRRGGDPLVLDYHRRAQRGDGADP